VNLLKLSLTFLLFSVILNAGGVSWSSGVAAPLDKSVLIVLFTAILLIGLWFSRKAHTSIKMSLVTLVLVSGAYQYNLNAAPKTITMSSPSGSDTFIDADGFLLVNNTGGPVSVTITPGAGYSCPTGGCNLSITSDSSSSITMLSASLTATITAAYTGSSGRYGYSSTNNINSGGTITAGFTLTANGKMYTTTDDYTIDSYDFESWFLTSFTDAYGGSAIGVNANGSGSPFFFAGRDVSANDTITLKANGNELSDVLALTNGPGNFGLATISP